MLELIYKNTNKSLFIILKKSLQSSSVGKESSCSAGDPGLIPGLGRYPGEENSNPLQNSCLENPMDRGAWGATVYGVAKVRHDVATKLPPLVKCILILIHIKMDWKFFFLLKII